MPNSFSGSFLLWFAVEWRELEDQLLHSVFTCVCHPVINLDHHSMNLGNGLNLHCDLGMPGNCGNTQHKGMYTSPSLLFHFFVNLTTERLVTKGETQNRETVCNLLICLNIFFAQSFLHGAYDRTGWRSVKLKYFFFDVNGEEQLKITLRQTGYGWWHH